MRVDCPKCGGHSAWYSKDHQDVTLRCLCGYLKVVATRLGEMTIEHLDSGPEVRLPRRGTKLYACLVGLCGLMQATTQEVLEDLNRGRPASGHQSMSDVASQLTVLRYKGLVVVTVLRKGLPGGSTWTLTQIATKLIKGV